MLLLLIKSLQMLNPMMVFRALSKMKSKPHVVCQGEKCQTNDKPHYLVGTPVDGQICCTII